MVARPVFPRVARRFGRWVAPALLVAAALGAALTTAGAPAPAARPAQTPGLTDTLQVGGAVNALDRDGNRVYVGVGPRVFTFVVEPGTALQPRLLATSPVLPGLVLGVTAHGNVVYVGLGPAGLAILDVSDPTAPRVVGSMSGAASQVVVQDPYIYLVGGTEGIRVVDARDPTQPKEVARFGQFVNDLAVSGTLAFTVARNLVMWNLADLANIRQLRELSNWADAVAVDGVVVYGITSVEAGSAQRAGSVETWDVTNTRRPVALGKVPLAGQGRFARLDGGHLVVLSDQRLEVFDASDPAGLAKIHSAPALAPAQEAELLGDHAWLAAGSQSLRAVPLSGSGAAEGERLLDLPGRAETLAIDGDRLYVEDADERILVYRGADLAAGPIGRLALSVEDGAMVAVDGYLYLATPDKAFKVFDVRDVANMREIASLTVPQVITRVAVGGGHAYLASDPYLRVVDVRSPAQPRIVAQVQPTGGITDLALEGEWLYVTGPNTGPRPQPSLKVMDVSQPLAPDERAVMAALNNTGGLAAQDRLVYVSGLQIVDACRPTAPIELARLTTPGRSRDLALDSWRVYLARRGLLTGGELQLVDARFPRRPVLAASLPAADSVDDVVARTGAFWAAAREGGLLAGRSPDVYFATPTPDLRPTATRPPGLDQAAYLPLLRFDRYVRPCPAP